MQNYTGIMSGLYGSVPMNQTSSEMSRQPGVARQLLGAGIGLAGTLGGAMVGNPALGSALGGALGGAVSGMSPGAQYSAGRLANAYGGPSTGIAQAGRFLPLSYSLGATGMPLRLG